MIQCTGSYVEACEKLYLNNIILKDAIIDAINEIKNVGEYEIARSLEIALEKTYE